ncbi:hypothetical protein EVAR_31520_1 [Eumeta japonica]|uniref:Uncharacterized protein n=1 Tax=Eumeta variegata TaxID=151549 RepID=A0A4C1YYN4_EUMVA|nr:hypothetical protein EVAR_31520_1 [Eumeta japonica]
MLGRSRVDPKFVTLARSPKPERVQTDVEERLFSQYVFYVAIAESVPNKHNGFYFGLPRVVAAGRGAGPPPALAVMSTTRDSENLFVRGSSAGEMFERIVIDINSVPEIKKNCLLGFKLPNLSHRIRRARVDIHRIRLDSKIVRDEGDKPSVRARTDGRARARTKMPFDSTPAP